MTPALRCAMSALVLTLMAACSSTPDAEGSQAIREVPPDAPTGSHIMRRGGQGDAKVLKGDAAEAVLRPGAIVTPAQR